MQVEPEDNSVTQSADQGVKLPPAERRRRALLSRLRPSVPYQALNFFFLTLGALLAAFAFDLFLEPSHVAPGGITGLTLVVTRFVPLPNGVLLLALNVPLLYLGYRALGGRRFLLRTVYVVVVMGLAIDLLKLVLPPGGLSTDPLLNAFYGGAILGVATAMITRAFGNIGGTAILGRVIQRKTGMPIGQIYLLTDGAIVLLLGIAFGWERALYSLVALFVSGIVTDYGIEGPSIVRTVFIITERPREVAEALQLGLRTGVTGWKGEGMFKQSMRTVLFCTVNRTEVRELQRIVREVDSEGFLVIGQGQTATGGTIGKSDAPG